MPRFNPRSNRPVTRRQFVAASAAGAFFVAGAAPHATSAQGTPAPAVQNGEWRFTDDRGVAVALAERPRRIVAQVVAAATLWDYGIRPVGIFGPQLRVDGSREPLLGDVDLDTVESIGEIWGDFDVERLIALRPDLLVATWYGPYQGKDLPLWYVPEEVAPVVEGAVPGVGILTEDVSIAHAVERFAELAELLGADMSDPQIVADKARHEAAVADLRDAIAANPGLTVIAVNSDIDNLYVAHPAAVADMIFFRDLGLDVVVPDIDPEEYWHTLSWEQANIYDADLILRDVRTGTLTPEQLMEIPTWRELPAVQAGQVADWHLEPIYSWRGYAPILEDLAGVIRNARADIV